MTLVDVYARLLRAGRVLRDAQEQETRALEEWTAVSEHVDWHERQRAIEAAYARVESES